MPAWVGKTSGDRWLCRAPWLLPATFWFGIGLGGVNPLGLSSGPIESGDAGPAAMAGMHPGTRRSKTFAI
jgi:hypothetical protein